MFMFIVSVLYSLYYMAFMFCRRLRCGLLYLGVSELVDVGWTPHCLFTRPIGRWVPSIDTFRSGQKGE